MRRLVPAITSRRTLLAVAILPVAALAAMIAVALASTADSSEAAGPPTDVGSAVGRVIIQGHEAYIRVTVATVSGVDAEAAARAEVLRRGGVPVNSVAYSQNGKWRQFSDSDTGNDQVELHYWSGSAAPTGYAGQFTAATAAWNNVTTSSFVFSWVGDTTTCPSLVADCPLSQFYSNANEVGWLDLGGISGGSITLGVTYYNFKSRGRFAAPQEADMVLNTNEELAWGDIQSPGYSWPTFDITTVGGHEFGHMAGLGHSNVSGALMAGGYTVSFLVGSDLVLHGDDEAGISALYPAGGEDPEPTPEPGSWCDTHLGHKQWDRKCG